jgi:hypothetical protein
MATIILNEEQLNRLFITEDDDDDVILDGDDDIKKLGDDARTSPSAAIITGKDGEEEMSDPLDTDDAARQLSNQMYWRMTKRF